MAEEISFVEVIVSFYKSGDKAYQYEFEDADCLDVSWEKATEEIEEVIKAKEENERRQNEAIENKSYVWTSLSLGHEPDTLVIQSITTFDFRCFGQSLDSGYASGLAWEIESMDAAYVFEGWLEDLKEIAQKILADKKAMNHPKRDSKTVRFVTLWSYSSWQDSYNKEWDSEWELLGHVDPKQVKSLLK